MADQERFSTTMRIDLIPDVPVKPTGQKEKGPVIQSPTQRPVLNKPRIVSTAGSGDAFYQHLLQGLYDAAIISDMDGRVADVNHRVIDFMRAEKDDLLNMTVFDIISGADAGLIDNLCENLKTTHHALIQAYCMRSDETFFPAEIAVSQLELDVPHLIFFVRDITIRKQAEDMLITEHCAIQNSAGGIAITDNEGLLDFVNPRVVELWGLDEENYLEEHLASLMVEPDSIVAMLNALVEDDSASLQGDMQGTRADGTVFDVQVIMTRNRSAEGEPIGFVCSIVDLSDRKRAEDAERLAERRSVMIESLGAACHHVGQPATILLGNLQMLKDTLGATDDKSANVLDRCLEAMEEISEILGRLNKVNEYKTRQYLEGDGDDESASRILEI